jgi:hypothetical protein
MLVGILTAASGCDKPNEDATSGAGPTPAQGGADGDSATRPNVLFLVFGDTSDPRAVPLARLGARVPEPLSFSESEWRAFDSVYFAPGSELTAYRAAAPAGKAVVTRAMWAGQETPLYSLPGCRSTVPLAGVSMRPQPRESFSVELLATTRELPQATRPAPGPLEVERAGGEIVRAAAQRAGIDTGRIVRQNVITHAIMTGASGAPTVVASHLEPGARRGEARAGTASHILVITDSLGEGRVETYSHVAGDAPTGEFRRLIDRLDVDGDGVDELLLEGWRMSGEAFPIILKWSGRRWEEVFRGRESWCLDAPRRR